MILNSLFAELRRLFRISSNDSTAEVGEASSVTVIVVAIVVDADIADVKTVPTSY